MVPFALKVVAVDRKADTVSGIPFIDGEPILT